MIIAERIYNAEGMTGLYHHFVVW